MKLALLGDIALIGKYDLTRNQKAGLSIEKISKVLEPYDYVIGNLETPLTNRTKTWVGKSMHLKSPAENVEILKMLNIDAVSLANNHTFDYGRKAIDDTVDILRENNIDFFGLDNKSILVNNVSISGYCCYSTNAFGYNSSHSKKGVNALQFEKVLNQVKHDKKSNNISLLSVHWGDEHTNYPRFDHIKFARFLAAQNNIIVNGHHPHVIQGVERIQNSVIAYSQGNFCFDDCVSISGTGMVLKQNDENRESFILEVEIDSNNKIQYRTIGIREVNDEIILSPIQDKLDKISRVLADIKNLEEYQGRRVKQFLNPEFRLKKFGKRNLTWYLKRLNYYSIFAFIQAKLNSRKYIKYFSSQL